VDNHFAPETDSPSKKLLADAMDRSVRYLVKLPTRRVTPTAEAVNNLQRFFQPLPLEGADPAEVLKVLDELGSPATVATAGGRYFGLVVGGALPVTVAANWLATAWDQTSVFRWTSPIACALEDISLKWLSEVFELPEGCKGALVSGATMANMAALAAARHALMARAGWDVESHGLFDAPPIRVVVGEEVHVAVRKALSLLGMGRDRIIKVPVDRQGRIKPEALPALDHRTIVCIQAGNVNSGAFDPASDIGERAHNAGAWVHVDGAFGLWAKGAPGRSSLAQGFEQADSWATDAHKWLNVPYDSGIVFVRNSAYLRAAMAASAAYLSEGAFGDLQPSDFTPEFSRRARGVEIWAALRHLGRAGLAELVERSCEYASHFAEGLALEGFDVLNDVVLNQVVVSFGSPEITRATIAKLQADGICWCGGTIWQGHTAMRISVSSWATTSEDVEISLQAIVRAAREECPARAVAVS
jgi:glutamate/tyrosine decarboxylase-like PLP-dependent enzyme